MFAVLKTGGKQYKVSSGDTLRVEKLAADAGEKVQFNDVLMLGGDTTVLGSPLVAGAAVQAEVIDQIKGDKVIHFVKRRRKHGSKRTKGHRQQLTLIRVTDILADGADASGVKAAIGAGSAPAGAPNAAAKTEAAVETGDDLTQITGVGPAAAKKLAEAGVTTFAGLAAVDAESFEAVKVKSEWIEQAKELAAK
ncbi:MAG: 50S ribosomal protein L21 [Rhodobacteraceae bacterium]|nr:MAG: 50S ribosomal protein L21 [Paracoccaceae bacterium]